MMLMVYSNRDGTPLSYRHMNAYGCNTFSFVNEKKERVWVKFHIISQLGGKGLTAVRSDRTDITLNWRSVLSFVSFLLAARSTRSLLQERFKLPQSRPPPSYRPWRFPQVAIRSADNERGRRLQGSQGL